MLWFRNNNHLRPRIGLSQQKGIPKKGGGCNPDPPPECQFNHTPDPPHDPGPITPHEEKHQTAKRLKPRKTRLLTSTSCGRPPQFQHLPPSKIQTFGRGGWISVHSLTHLPCSVPWVVCVLPRQPVLLHSGTHSGRLMHPPMCHRWAVPSGDAWPIRRQRPGLREQRHARITDFFI